VRRYRREPARPTVLIGDASFELVSVLEERRVEFPGLIIQSSPKRFYPDGPAVAAIVGYTGEISEAELGQTQFESYKAGQQVGKDGLERQYESRLRGREEGAVRGGRRARPGGARARPRRRAPRGPAALYTNIDLDLQLAVAEIFGDSLVGGVVAMEPRSGEVLALHSAPSFDPNRFIGGIPRDYWQELQEDPRRPLYNKAIKGTYPPASTWKLATAIIGLEEGLVHMGRHMPVPCTGGYQFGNRYFRCWKRDGPWGSRPGGGDRELVQRLLLAARPGARGAAPRSRRRADGDAAALRGGPAGRDRGRPSRMTRPRSTTTGSTAPADGRRP
jgi:penicillin-binding protein 2